MEDKISQLQTLVQQATQKLQSFEAENSTLKNRLRAVENQIERLRGAEGELRALRDWKRETLAQLKKLHARIEKELR
ncbi:MAG: hypothetical protein LBI01_07160 [Elusimicrobium sp.]|jgi:chromosome segregation ATPase|nr:hypothetical protein [Elusimicrobium sp.]